jgi:hypothetical protein
LALALRYVSPAPELNKTASVIASSCLDDIARAVAAALPDVAVEVVSPGPPRIGQAAAQVLQRTWLKLSWS